MPLVSWPGTSDSALGTSFVLGNPNAHSVQFELDAFNADPATDASRIIPVGIVPADGTHVFCLGRDTTGLVEYLLPGSYVEISQSFTVTGTTIAFQARTRGPKIAPPTGYSWKASVLIDGVEIGSRIIYGKLPIDWDWKINWAALASGAHAVAFRLTLVGPAMPPAPAFPYLLVEVPAFYVDNLVATTDTAPFITNESPAINQGISNGYGPPGTTSIAFDVFDPSNDVRFETLNVTVNGAQAIAGGAFVAGWSGTITGDASGVLHVVANPASTFASASVVTVVATAQNGSAQNASRTWQFEIADTTPPAIYGAVAIGPKQVRTTWTKAIELTDPTLPHDGLNPALYSLAFIQPNADTPAVAPNVVSAMIVSAGTPSVVDLFTDIELTPTIGVEYTLTESGVSDTVGNSGTSAITFPTFTPPKPDGRSFDLYRMLPQLNRQEDVTHDLKKFVACMQEVTDLLLYDVDQWTDILDVDVTPEPFLDAMLADLGNPFPFLLTANQKRQLVRILVAIYKQKGTIPGIVNTVRFFTGITVTVSTYTGDTMHLGISELGVDWILGPGNRFALYAFRVVSPVALTDDQRAQIAFIAKYMKCAHEHFIEIVEPTTPPVYAPVELGVSKLGVDWLLH